MPAGIAWHRFSSSTVRQPVVCDNLVTRLPTSHRVGPDRMTVQGDLVVGPAQAVVAPLTRDAIFIVVTVNPDARSRETVRDLCADLAALIRAGRLP